jgi:hypothetical protein
MNAQAFADQIDGFRTRLVRERQTLDDLSVGGVYIVINQADGTSRQISLESPEARRIMERYVGKPD